MTIVSVLLGITGIYLLAGFVFAIPFIIKGVTQIDEAAIGSGWDFRIIILPGTIVLWPVLLSKWRKSIKKLTND